MKFYDSLKDRAARNNIEIEMQRMGINASELARRLDKSPQYVYKILKGLKPVGDESAIDFARVFGYSDYLKIYRLEDNMAPEVVTRLWNRILETHDTDPRSIEIVMNMLELLMSETGEKQELIKKQAEHFIKYMKTF